MRRFWSLSILLIGTLLATGCSDQMTEGSPPDMMEVPGTASVALGCVPAPTAASLLTMVNGLLPNSPLRTSLIILIGSLPTRAQDRIKTAVRRLIFPVQDLVLRSFYAGRLSGGTSTATFNKVLRFIEALYCYVGLTPPDFPTTTAGEDIVVAVLFPNSPTTNVVVPSGHGAVRVPTGSVPTGGATLIVRKLPDGPPGPLNTTLDQFPFFYEFTGTTAAGAVTFNSDVITGVCPRDDLSAIQASLRLAHNVGTAFGTAEVLPLAGVGNIGLNCTNLPQFSSAGTLEGWFASSGWMGRTLRPIGRALLPQPLFAASLATVGVGGTTRKFSPFGIVDISSNPANLDFNPDAGTFEDLTAPPGGAVTAPSVKLESENGDPIANWPVSFAITTGGGTINGTAGPVTVTTGPNGTASLTSWNLGSTGVNTVSATPTSVSQLPAEPGPADAFRPAGAFDPTSLTFTAEVDATVIDYSSAGFRYITIQDDPPASEGTPDYPAGEWFLGEFEPGEAWSTGEAPFGQAAAGCNVFSDHPVNTTWNAAAGTVGDPGTGSGILLRKTFTVPSGFVGNLVIKVAVDNDVQLYLDDQDITQVGFVGIPNTEAIPGAWLGFDSPFQTHGGCAKRGDGTFTVPSTYLEEGTQHLLAVYAHDAGSASYFDVEITLVPTLIF